MATDFIDDATASSVAYVNDDDHDADDDGVDGVHFRCIE